MKEVIVLAMHGAPPVDAPELQVALTVGLHMAMQHGPGPLRALIEGYHARLDTRIRTWPRTAENDPFYAASKAVAAALSRETGAEVIVGFNEFCSPDLDEALDQAAEQGPDRVWVVTPMLTRGGEHAESDIPQTISRARERHRGVEFAYAWPFEDTDVARFLAAQIERSAQGNAE
jgi:sirohydrochlorin cobaltochelatase